MSEITDVKRRRKSKTKRSASSPKITCDKKEAENVTIQNGAVSPSSWADVGTPEICDTPVIGDTPEICDTPPIDDTPDVTVVQKHSSYVADRRQRNNVTRPVTSHLDKSLLPGASPPTTDALQSLVGKVLSWIGENQSPIIDHCNPVESDPGLLSSDLRLPSSNPGLLSPNAELLSSNPGLLSPNAELLSSNPGELLPNPALLSSNHGLPSSIPGVLSSNPGPPSSNPGLLSTNIGLPSSNPGLLSSNPGSLSSNPGSLSSNHGLPSANPGLPSENPGQLSSNPGQLSSNHGMPLSIPGPLSSNGTVNSIVKTTPDRRRKYLQWSNVDALCWMDVALCLLVHCTNLNALVATSGADRVSLVRSLIVRYEHVLDLWDNRTSRTGCKDTKPMSLETSVGKVSVKTGGGEIGRLMTDVTVANSSVDTAPNGSVLESYSADKTKKSKKCDEKLSRITTAMACRMLGEIRDGVLACQPKLLCERGHNHSPVFALPLLLGGDDRDVQDLFRVEYCWRMKCSQCRHSHQDRYDL